MKRTEKISNRDLSSLNYSFLSGEIESNGALKTASGLAMKEGVRIYLVGGFVRDCLIGKETKEFDILVIGDGIDFARKLIKILGADNLTFFKNFGTAHFTHKNFSYEFVGARKESYKRDSRNPVIEQGSFEDDISRRDFTINTLAVSLNSDSYGLIIDNYDGQKDLIKRIIRTPIDPFITFDDDPLRILRAFRFASQLDFNLDEEITKAASGLADRLKIVSQERITDEFLKILSSPVPSKGLIPLYTSGVMRVIFPEIASLGGIDQRKDYHHKDVFYHTCEVVDNIAVETGALWLRFAALVHDIAKPLTKKFVDGTGWTFHGHEELGARMMTGVFKRMKLPFHKLDYIEKLIRLHLRPIALVDDKVTDSAIRRLIVAAGEELDDLITLCRADITSKNPAKVKKYLNNYEKVMLKVKEVREKDSLRAFQSPVRGEEIMRAFDIPPSKKVGEIKSAIENAILDGKIGNTHEDAYEYMLTLKKSGIFD